MQRVQVTSEPSSAAQPARNWTGRGWIWTGPSLAVRLSDRWQAGVDVDVVRGSVTTSRSGASFEDPVQEFLEWRLEVAPAPRLWVSVHG